MRKYIEVKKTKNDLKNIEELLLRNSLIDGHRIWFAGFPYMESAEQNTMAANLFYGNKRLKIVSVKDGVVYFMHNKKDMLSVYEIGNVNDIDKVFIVKKIMHPVIRILYGDQEIHLQINKNKEKLKEFKKQTK